MADVLQSAHFFSRVPATATDIPQASVAYVFLNPTTGRYVFANSIIPGWTQVWLANEGDGRVHLDSASAGARVIALYGTAIQL